MDWDTLLAAAALSRSPPAGLLLQECASLQKYADDDRVAFLAWLKSEYGLPLGDRQRLCNALARMGRLVAAPPAKAAIRRFSSAAEAIEAGQVAFVTLTNFGYLPYTVNCLTSLELVGERVPLTVYCADSKSHYRLSKMHQNVVQMHEEGLDRFLAWKQPGWARLMWLKCEIMRRALATHEFVVFTDGDITYERPGAVAHCVELLMSRGDINHHDGNGDEDGIELVMQSDGLQDGGSDGWGLCAGFMAARSTPSTRAIFAVDESNTLKPGWDDQRYLNGVLGRLKHLALPLKLFPNGQYFRAHRDKLVAARPGPFLIHFNWIVGSDKKAVMAEAKKWYIAGEEKQWAAEESNLNDPLI